MKLIEIDWMTGKNTVIDEGIEEELKKHLRWCRENISGRYHYRISDEDKVVHILYHDNSICCCYHCN